MSAPQVACPHCGKKHPYLSSDPFRPFCSERCKLIDLGKWADESYRVPQTDELPSIEDLTPRH